MSIAGSRSMARASEIRCRWPPDSPRFVMESFEAAINPRPQPPRPDKIKIHGEAEQKLIELACSEPPQGHCEWTLQLLANQLVVLGYVDSVGRETVRQALKKTPSNSGW
jgi:hypothetical protein